MHGKFNCINVKYDETQHGILELHWKLILHIHIILSATKQLQLLLLGIESHSEGRFPSLNRGNGCYGDGKLSESCIAHFKA